MVVVWQKKLGFFGGCRQQLSPHSLWFGRKLYKLRIFFACKRDCSFCPVSSTLIRADKAVQGPLVYLYVSWKNILCTAGKSLSLVKSGWVLSKKNLYLAWLVYWASFWSIIESLKSKELVFLPNALVFPENPRIF